MFTKEFYWGASSSAFQIEGAWDEDGKGLTVADHNALKRRHLQADTSVTSDFYHQYKTDIAMMKELGLNMYRFSISWARIIPDGEGDINPKGIAFYNQVINELLKNNIEPFITLYHFDLPFNLVEKYNGWASKKTVDAFVTYAKVCYENFGDRVQKWQIHNEQNLMIRVNERMNIYDVASEEAERLRVLMDHHLFLAYAKASSLCKALVKGAQVGPSISATVTYPLTNAPEDVMSAIWNNRLKTDYCLDTHVYGAYPQYYIQYLRDTHRHPFFSETDLAVLKESVVDFIAVNYYKSLTSRYLADDANNLKGKKIEGFNIVDYNMYGYWEIVKNKNLKESEYGSQIDPTGLSIALMHYWTAYKKPLIITENGLGATDIMVDDQVHDAYRINYIKDHLLAIHDVLQEGIPVLGYNCWSFMDVLSSHQGFTKRYGLIFVDRTDFDIKSLKRVPKDSYYWYQAVIASNGEKLK